METYYKLFKIIQKIWKMVKKLKSKFLSLPLNQVILISEPRKSKFDPMDYVRTLMDNESAKAECTICNAKVNIL